MYFSETMEGLYKLFFFDKATPEGNYEKEDKNTLYIHWGWYLAMAVCLFLGLKIVFKRYFPSKKTSQTQIAQRNKLFSQPLTDIIRRMFGLPVDDANTINPVHQVDPMRSMQLPRIIRKSLQEKSQTKILRSYNVHDNIESPQMVKDSTADISKVSELSSRYKDAVSGSGQFLKGQNSVTEPTRMSSQVSQEKPVRQYSVDSPHSADVALQVTHTSVSQGDSNLSLQLSQQLSLQLSQKWQCEQLEMVAPQRQKGALSQQEEIIDSNTRCIGDLELDRKLPQDLTYPNPATATHKMRSVFSRTKLGKKCRSEANVYDDLRFEDGASCHTSLSFSPGQKINTMLDMLKAPSSVAKKTCEISGTDSHHGHSISHTESHKVAATSGVEKTSVTHLCKEKGYSVRSLADVYTSLMCLNKTHNILTAPVVKYEDCHDGSNPAGRKWQKVYKNRLEAIDLSYTSCPGKHPLVFEIFAPGASKIANTGKVDRHCHISEANYENRRSLKRSRRASASKDEHCDSMAVDVLEIVATKMQPADFKKSKSSKMGFARKRKQIRFDIQNDTLESKIKEDHRSLAGNDICSSFTGTDISLGVHKCRLIQGLKENQICHSVKGYAVRPTATELNITKCEHVENEDVPGIWRKEMPQTSNVHTKQRHKSRTTMLSLSDRRPESIRMVESLLSMTEEHPKGSNKVLAITDASISQTLRSKKGKSIAFSLSPAKSDEQLNIETAIIPEHVKIDFMKMPYENGHIKNKMMVKKNLRFAADTETHGGSDPMFNVTMTAPSTGSKIQQIVRLTSENTEDGQTHKQSNKTHHRHVKSSNDYQKLVDKFIPKKKDDIKNAVRICQSAESNICEEMRTTQPQSPASVRNQKTRSRAMQYASLMSFLDHKEKRNNGLKDRKYIHREDKKRHTVKNSVGANVYATEKKWADKDAFVTQKIDLGMAACLHGSKLGTGIKGVATEGKQVNSLSDFSCPHLITPSNKNKMQNQDANLGLHFGTNNLQLYSESVDSISFPKRDNKTITDIEALIPCQSRTGDHTKQNCVLKSEPTSNIESQQKFRRSKTEAKIYGSPTTKENRELKPLRRTSFRTIKELSQRTLTHEHNGLHEVKPSVLNSRKPDMERAQHIAHHQAMKNVAPSSTVKVKSKTKRGLTQSRLAIPDPTRGSENLDVTGGGDSPKMSDAQMLITECRVEKSTHSPSHDAVGNIDTFKDIISLDHHQSKSPMSEKSIRLSSNRSHSIELSSPRRMSAVAKVSGSPAHLDTSLNEMKSMYPCNKISSPVTKMPLVLKAKNTKGISAEELKSDNTQPRIRKRIRRLKTSSLGHVISKLSEAEIKPPKDDALRDTDVSSTSKSLASTDINTTHTIQSMASDTKDKMPVIVKKLLINSTKRQSDNLQMTSGCEKQHLPQKEPTSPVPNVVPASFSRSLQPLQSIRRGSLKDIFDRYVVHTTEYPQRHATKITGKPVRYTKKAESDMHCSLTDHDASIRSASIIPYQLKPEVSQRNISSYTSKYRANDNIDKSGKPTWRGTVAFRKRLQHLLQHNKHIQHKYQHINMAAKKTSSADISPRKLNSHSLLAGKDKLASIYKVSRIVRPGHDVSSHDIVLDTLEPGKGNNIYSAHKVVTPVSKPLDVRHESMDCIVDNSNKDFTVFSVKSPLRVKTTDAGNNIVPLIVSPAASNPIETLSFASSQKWTTSKSIITHSDHFEQKIQCQLKRQKAAMDHKLHQMKGNLETKPLINVKRTGTPTKPSVPSSVFNRRAFGGCPRVALLHKLSGKGKEKQKETIVNVVETKGKDLVVANEQAKSATEVANSPHNLIPGNHQVPNTDGTVPETVTAKLHNAVQAVGLDSSQSVNPSDIHAEVTRCDFFTSNEEQFVSAGDTRFMATIKKEMTHVSETEHNLQLLLDKIKHRSFIIATASNDKEKEGVDTLVGITENPDINVNTIKHLKLHPKLAKNQKYVERLTHTLPLIEYAKEITEQTKSNFITDKNAVASTTCATSESFPPSSSKIVKESTRSQKSGIEIIRIHEGNKKTDSHVKSKALSKTEFTVKNRKQSMIIDKGNTRIDGEAKMSARKIMYNKYRLMPRNKAKRLTASLDNKTSPAKESCTTVVPNVKHVAFNLNELVDKSNTESYVTITSGAASQGSSETLNTDFWCKEAHDDDTDMLNSHTVKTASVHNKVRQTMSVLNILCTDVVEQVDKNTPRKDIQNDQISDTSHTYERQQSSTEHTGKLLYSSGYGSMDILSTTSFSQLHNSSCVEPGKLAIEMGTAHGIPSSYNDTHCDVYDDVPLRVCKQSEIFHETAERAASSLTTSFWKKEMHMDVIPEEADNENGIDNHTDLDNAKNKLTELEIKKFDFEETFLKHTTGKEYVAEGVVADKTTNDAANKTGVEDINNECEIVYLEKCKAGQEDNHQAVNLPVPTQDFDDDYMEMCGDVMESSLGTHPNERNNVTDSRSVQEASLHHAEDIVWNPCDTASGYSPSSDTCAPEEIIRDSTSSPHIHQAVTETVSQIVGTHMHLMNNIVPENESYDCSVLSMLGSKPLNVDVPNAALDCPLITNKEEAHCEKVNETLTLINGGNNIVAAKDSSSFTTEANSERPDPCNHHMYSSLLAKALETRREVSQSKSDSTAAKHETGVCDLMSATEVSKQSMFLGERNKSDLTTVPLKSTTYDIQESKSLSSMPEQSYGSSENSLSEGVFKCTDDLEVTSHKQHHEEIKTQSIVNKVGLIVECAPKEDTDFRQATVAKIRTVGSSSQTELPNSDDESTLQKLSEPSAANLLVQGGSSINLNKTCGQEFTQSRGKRTPDTNMRSRASNGSETTMSNCSRTGCITALDCQPTVKTQTSEFNFYSADGVRMQTSVGLQTGYAIDGENIQRSIDNSSSCQNRDVVLEAMVSSISSGVEVTKVEKYRSKITSDTKSVSSSSSKDKIDQNDQSVVTVIHEQNANVTKERPALQAEVGKKHRFVARDSGHQAHPEGSSQSAKDDLESLLNKELSQVNAIGGVRQECDVNRLFGTYYERITRREKRRRRTEKTLNQLPSQRELQYHFMRENDGSVKNTSSNTSQRTVFSPSDAGTQHSSRAIRPLSLGRVTKLEEFLQKAEETNRSETVSNISRAVSKLSSLTSVTPTSQEVQLQPLTRQTRSKLKQKAADTTGNKSHEASEKDTVGGISLKSSQLSRSKNLKANQLHSTKISENQHQDNNGQFASCTSNNDQSPYQDYVSDCTGNNSDPPVDRCSRLNMISKTAEQTHGWSYSNQVLRAGYDIPTEMTAVARAKDNMLSQTTLADAGSNTYLIQNETSVDMRAPEVVSPSNNLDKHMSIEQVHLIADTATTQTTDECSALSTSSSSIVLSWIGSDLGDTEEIIQTPNFTQQDDKLYSDVSELNNYYLHSRQTNEASEFPQAAENAQQSHAGYQSRELYCADVSKVWRSTFSDSVPHSTTLGGILLQESDWGMLGYGSQYDSNEKPRTSYLSENVGKSQLPRLKQSKDMLSMHTSLPSTEHALFETHMKEAQQASQAQLSSSHYFKCPQTERCSCSPASQKTPRQICTFWNNNPKECMLEQPSYFNALLRDPKWNPSFEVKEVSNKVGHNTDENSATGSYVQSAWTYQRVRHMSPSSFSPQKGQDYCSIPSDSVKQQFKTHEQHGAHLVSSTSALQSNTKISFDVCGIHSSELDLHNHRYQTAQTPPRSDFIIQQHPAIQHHKQDKKSSTHLIASQGFSTRAITKQNTFLKKVHFDGNFQPDETGPAYLESLIKPNDQSWPLVYSTNDKKLTQQTSLDKHLRKTTRSGALPMKGRLPSEQRSQGTEASKTKTKLSLEQHLCSALGTDRNPMSNAPQPSSENGTTKSTSSHASLNWYKPQSLPSSTSVSNGNTSHGHQETSTQQETTGVKERTYKPLTPQREFGITLSTRRSTSENTRRQDTHTLVHSAINRQNLATSLPGSTHGKSSVQKSKKFNHRTQNNLLTQTLIPSLIPRAQKGSSESLSTPSSISVHSSNKYHAPGFWWLQDPDTRRVARHILPQSPSGNILPQSLSGSILPQSPSGNTSHANGSKSTRGLTNTNNQPRHGSKPSDDCEVQALANQSRGISSNNKKKHTFSNNHSHSSPVNSETKSEVPTKRESKNVYSHVQPLKKSRGLSDCSATTNNQEPRTIEDLPGTRNKTKSLSTHLSDASASESHHLVSADSASPFKGTRRVSKLVEMFEKKLEN